MAANRKAKRSPWPTIWAALPIFESDHALELAGTNGLAVYVALHKLRFRVPFAARGAFYASASQIAHQCGISERRLRAPLRKLETGGLVKIQRPVGAARMAHDAFQYSLIPVFVTGNKVRFGPDKTSGRERTDSPAESGQEVGANLSDSSIAPLTGEDIEPPAALAGDMAPASRDGEKKENMNDQWY